MPGMNKHSINMCGETDDEMVRDQLFKRETDTLKTITVPNQLGKGVLLKLKFQLSYAKISERAAFFSVECRTRSYKGGLSFSFFLFLKRLHNLDTAWPVFTLLLIVHCTWGKKDWTPHAYHLDREVKIKKYLSSSSLKQEWSASWAGRKPCVSCSYLLTIHVVFLVLVPLPTWMLNSAGILTPAIVSELCIKHVASQKTSCSSGEGQYLTAKLSEMRVTTTKKW